METAGAVAFPLAERLAAARARLLALYAAGCELPAVDPPEDIDAGPSPEPPPRWPGFGDLDAYSEVFNPYAPSAPVGGSLSDDVLDVYRDVRRGLALWDAGHRLSATWEWRFHFDIHWGDHAVDALRALHRACKRAA